MGSSERLLEGLYAALHRLQSERPTRVAVPYRINMKTVCTEAGRHRSSIRSTPQFEQLRRAIAGATAPSADVVDRLRRETAQLKLKLQRCQSELAEKKEMLAQAGETILRLHVAMASQQKASRKIIR